MFIGHFAVGFAAKKAAPSVSLGVLMIVSQFLDLLWPVLLLTGAERLEIKPGIVESNPMDFVHYPWSHSLGMVLVWAAVFAVIYWLFKRNTKASLILGLCVVSHWLLDLVVHIPDLPLYPGSKTYGLGLWHYVAATLVVEFLLLAIGVSFYLRATRAKNKTGKVVLWVLIVLLAVIQILNAFGPAPTDVNAIAWAGNLQWLFVILAFWADRNRKSIVKDNVRGDVAFAN